MKSIVCIGVSPEFSRVQFNGSGGGLVLRWVVLVNGGVDLYVPVVDVQHEKTDPCGSV
ncbi:MAG: hypothetical protein RLN78_02890 [Phycisphaerales bacterium]